MRGRRDALFRFRARRFLALGLLALGGALLLAASGLLAPAWAGDGPAEAARTAAPAGDPEVGRRLLLDKPYLPSPFDQEVFDAVWRTWPEPLRSRAAVATPDERRRMAYARYGLDARPGDASGRPLQYVVDEDGRWSMSCFACHGGQVGGRVVPGLGNANLALQTFAEEIRDARRLLGQPPHPGDLLLPLMPLGTTNGTTNAVMFSVALLTFRDADLEIVRPSRLWRMVHHDMDAPPWWHFRKKSHLYIDGFAPKGHRPLMQFLLVPQNDGATVRSWEDDFRHIRAYLESLEAPAWPYPVDAALAERGREVFEASCAKCHGTYGEEETYPNRYIPLDLVGTDPVRLEATTETMRALYARSWLTGYDPRGVVVRTRGYVAPPLDGVWASAPYFHNGSVPTLRHVLYPEERPRVWKRTRTGYDPVRVGLEVEVFDALPPEAAADPKVRRTVFDTTRRGKSAEGHLFPRLLDDAQRRALLEYLKTL